MKNNKKGVSLVTVLLFMLVATIAATATFKWLSSENRSSSSRMQISEAEQAAIAGIESARTWMAFHGNETGALVKQYFASGKKAIVLDSILEPLDNSDRQKYSVALVGVDATGATYKIKLNSVGTGRNGSKYGMSAILKVSGLYRVSVPSTKSDLSFKYAYFGGSISYQGDGKVSSMIVNGDWSGNPPSTSTGDFVITGNATLSGNNISIASTACIGGNLNTNNGMDAKNLYVRGTTNAFNGTISEDAYFGGPLNMGSTAAKGFTIGRNMTLDGVFTTKQNEFSHTVKGNMCFESNGKLVPNGTNNGFTVDGNVWMPGHNQVAPYSANYERLVFGNSAGTKVYIADAHPYSDYVTLRNSRNFTENSIYKKYCADSKQISSQDVWDIVIGDGGANNVFHASPNKDICGSWRTPAWKGTAEGGYYAMFPSYYAYYDRGWTNWTNYTYNPYPSVTSKENMYYFYYTTQTDVVYREEGDPTWKYFTGNAGANELEMKLEKANGEAEIWGPMGIRYRAFKPDQTQIGQKFSSPTPVASYFVNGVRFNDGRGHVNNFNYDGSKATGSPYCKASGDPYRPSCEVSPWFKSLGEVSNALPSERPFECANSVKSHCDSIWQAGSGCDGSTMVVPDPIKTAYETFQGYANNLKCSANLKQFDNNSDNVVVNALNSCYASTVANADSSVKLYNGFLVVKFSGNTNATPTAALNGKFIIIYENNAGTVKLPPSSGVTMMYFKNGASDVRPATCGGQPFNYFIYTEKDVDLLGNFKENGCQLNGTVYAQTKDNCAKVKASQGNSGEFIHYDPEIIASLTEAGALCGASAATCGGATTGGSMGEVTEASFSGYDSDYIATGAQLRIEMETQYKNEEAIADTQLVKPSIVVLPRIVYLNKDAVGTLSDYYTVKSLNGANISGSGAVTCPAGAPPTTGPLAASDTLNTGYFQCTYTEGSYSSSFYIVVTGLLSETPSPRFESPQDVDLNSEEENSRQVKLVIPGVPSSVGVEFTVDVKVSDDGMTSNGWTIDPILNDNFKLQSGSSGDKVYTYTGHTSSGVQTIPIFNVHTSVGAKSGSVSFMLQAPIGCAIGVPMVKYFNIHGKTTIKREGIGKYCQLHEELCPAGSTLAEYKDADDCTVDGIWVEAQPNCKPKEGKENLEWICPAGNGSSNPITLVGKSYDDRFCQMVIPSEENSVVGAKDDNENMDGGYTLYASVKKKRFNLHIDLVDTDKGKVVVKTRPNESSAYTTVKTCSDYDVGCDIPLYVDQQIQIVAEGNGDKFSYWTCSGAYCGKPNYEAVSVEFIMSGNYSFTALFNQRDEHCFYTDFAKTFAFCSNSTDEDCVDKCESSEHCGIGSGKYGNTPQWLMTYANGNKTWVPPTFVDGYISYNGGDKKNTNSSNGTQALILNRVVAGSNGLMTARIRTALINENKANEFLNNGFILRSNIDASDYIALDIYGIEPKKSGDPKRTVARICHATNQGITNSSGCVTKNLLQSDGSHLSVSESSILNVSITLNGNLINVSVNRMDGSTSWTNASTSFNLSSDWSLGTFADSEHQYVGFKISDDVFKVGDIGWKAADFSNTACFEFPSIDCSFSSNYLGGYVPVNEDVQPWIGFSSWFADKESCMSQVRYYYNGCDVPGSYFKNWKSSPTKAGNCDETTSEGFYLDNDSLVGLELNSNVYNFTEQGGHGTSYNGGIARNAFAAVNCEGTALPVANCGYFIVGKLQECSRNEFILSSPLSGSTSEIAVDLTTPVNLRAASLIFTVENLASTEYVDVVLEDVYGTRSSIRSITNERLELSVNEMSNTLTFNPEKVAKIYLTGSSSYTIKTISSSCPNVVSFKSCSVSYNGATWSISSELNHPESAKKCVVVPSPAIPDYTPEFVTCGEGAFYVDDANVINRLNSSTDESIRYDFILKVFDDENAELTSEPTDLCTATSETFNHGVVNFCTLEGLSSTGNVVQGQPLPKLNFAISNCPNCLYQVELSDGTKKFTTLPNLGEAGSITSWWQPGVNLDSPYLAERSYYYTVSFKSAGTAEFVSNTCESTTFNVVKAVDATGSCYINEDYLSVTVTGANYVDNVPVTVAYNDNIGIAIGLSSIGMNGNETRTVNLAEKLLIPGTYTISLKVSDKSAIPCGTYTVSEPESSSSSVASSSSVSLNVQCGISTQNSGIQGGPDFYESNGLYFVFKNNNNVSDSYSADVYKDGSKVATSSISNYSNWNSYSIGTLAAGDYTFDLLFNGNSVCSKTVTIKKPLTCSTDKTEIGIGESFVLTTTYAGSCWNSTLSGNGVPSPSVNCGGSHTITPTAVGTQTYTYKVTNGSNGFAECTETVEVKEKAPTCSVDKMEKTVSTDVTISPSTTGCTSSPCSYQITGGTKGGVSGSGYQDSDASLGYPLPGETTASTGDGVSYTLSLTNSVGTGTCYFKVNYKEKPVSSGCEVWVNGTGNYSGHCYNSGLNNMNGKCYKCNPERGSGCNAQWLNDNASDSYWWVETPCDGSGSGSTPGSSTSTPGSSASGGGIAVSSTKEFAPGTYSITCSGGGHLICWNPSGGEFTFTFDGQSCTAYGGEGWGSCGGGTCSSTTKTLTTTKTVRCKGGW